MNQPADPRAKLPSSISAEATAILQPIAAMLAAMPSREPPETLEDFDAAAARGEAFAAAATAAPLAKLAPRTDELVVNGTPVLLVRPSDVDEDASPLVYIHGGGFVSGSAKANLLTAAVAATTTGRTVYSVDYTLAPHADWRRILDQAVSAWLGILDRHDTAPGLFGDSAGGCIAAATTLLLRDRGITLPSALVLLSPVVDMSDTGDTRETLQAVDYLDRRTLAPARRAYADQADWRNPLVSPIHADFNTGFPPTLIQVGTREVLLSDAVRLHRRIAAAGGRSRLEVYEGMPHVFQPLLHEAPEGREAWAEMAAFWREHLR